MPERSGARGAVLIRLIKRLPAPMMDGFDVRRFETVNRIYTVDTRLGRYLIVAGYALQVDETAPDKAPKRGPVET